MIGQSEAFLGLIDVAIVSAALVAMLFAVVCITVGLFGLTGRLFPMLGGMVTRLQAELDARDQAEAALRESEMRLKEAQRLARLAYWYWSFETSGGVFWSDEAPDIFGRPVEDLHSSYQRYLDFVHPDDRQRLRAVYDGVAQCAEEPAGYQVEYRIVQPDGAVVWIDETARIEFDDHGGPLRTADTIQDITERRRIEDDLRESEAGLSAIVENGPITIGLKDVDGRHLVFGPQFEAMFGYGRDELVGMLVETLMPQSKRLQLQSYREAYAADPRVRPMGQATELRGVNRDGSEFPVEISLSPIHDDDGLLVVAAVRDITERRRTEETIRTRDAWLGGILENVPIQVVLKDTDGRIMAISQNGADFSG